MTKPAQHPRNKNWELSPVGIELDRRKYTATRNAEQTIIPIGVERGAFRGLRTDAPIAANELPV